MKNVILAATVVAASASAAFAGTYDVEPVIEAQVIVEEAASSSFGSVGGNAILLLVGAAALALALDSDSDSNS